MSELTEPKGNKIMTSRVLTTLAFLIAAGAASSGDTFVRCDDCTAFNSALRAENHFGSVVMFNPTTPAPSEWMFDVEYRNVGVNCYENRASAANSGTASSTVGEGCQRVKVASPAAITPFAQDFIDKYRAAYVSTSGTMKAAVELSFDNLGVPFALIPWTINAGGPDQGYTFVSAVDIVNNINVRDWVTNNATTAATSMQSFINSPIGAFMNALSNAVGIVFLGGDSSGLTLKINCQDGSSVTLTITQDMILLNSPATIENARDAEGRTVMTRQNIADFGGFRQPYTNSRDETTFSNNATLLGVDVINFGPGNGGRIMTCEWDGVELSCRISEN